LPELLSRLNWVDIFVVILLVRIGYISSFIGVGRQILPLFLLETILLITLYNYINIAAFFIKSYSFTPSTCRFFTFLLMTLAFFAIYQVIMRLTGMFFSSNTEGAVGIEKMGGVFLGILRSSVLLGIILINLLLFPFKFTEDSVKNSYTGFFFISANVNVYTSIANLIIKDEKKKISYDKTIKALVSEKTKYFFESTSMKNRSRFYKNSY